MGNSHPRTEDQHCEALRRDLNIYWHLIIAAKMMFNDSVWSWIREIIARSAYRSFSIGRAFDFERRTSVLLRNSKSFTTKRREWNSRSPSQLYVNRHRISPSISGSLAQLTLPFLRHISRKPFLMGALFAFLGIQSLIKYANTFSALSLHSFRHPKSPSFSMNFSQISSHCSSI